MSGLFESILGVAMVLALVGLGLVCLAYFGHFRFPYLGGTRMPWDDLNFALTGPSRRVCRFIGLLLLAVSLLMFVLAGIGAGI